MSAHQLIERLSVVGLGRLGLPLTACFAASGIPTVAIDIDAAKVAALQAGRLPFDENGLADILSEGRAAIRFSTDYADVAATDATIFLLPTPSMSGSGGYSHSTLLDSIRSVAKIISDSSKARHVFVVASTIMPGTLEGAIRPAITAIFGDRPFGLAYVPEFAALGDLIRGYRHPEFLLIGRSSPAVGDEVASLYRRIHFSDVPVESMPLVDAEIAKVTLNSYVCLKISFANFLGQYCAARGDADVDAITRIIGRDSWIGPKFLTAAMAYGGPCFTRDAGAFAAMARLAGLTAVQIEATEAVNRDQRAFVADTILRLRPRSVALLGLSFKPGTPVVEGSPSVDLARTLAALSIPVGLFDFSPDMRNAVAIDGARWHAAIDEAVAAHDCVAILQRDIRFAAVLDKVRPSQRVVDFWGILPDGPLVIRPGGRYAPALLDGAVM
jgi:UDPglucose 6-dehydrogenase